MAERTELISAGDAAMEIFIAHPDGPDPARPWFVIVQLMHGAGTTEDLREHARRTASWGYYVMAPDLSSFSLEDASSDSGGESVIEERATRDAQSLVELARKDPAARGGKLGLSGSLVGGRLKLLPPDDLAVEWERALLSMRAEDELHGAATLPASPDTIRSNPDTLRKPGPAPMDRGGCSQRPGSGVNDRLRRNEWRAGAK
jgi:hypothetical protein